MTRLILRLSPEAQALIDRERSIPAIPPAVRARAMARAREALARGDVRTSIPPRAAATSRWAASVVLACVASAAAGAAAYGLSARMQDARRVSPATPAVGLAAPGAIPSHSPAAMVVAPSAVVSGSTPHRASRSDAVREELLLLRRARGAVAGEDFAAALPPIAEHARRFKNGRLAEEREALRVKALVGLGRMEDARRAAAGFKARFPYSVLLPAVSQMPVSRP